MKREHSGYGDKEFVFMTRESIFLDVFTGAASADTGLVDGGFQILLPANFVGVEDETAPVTEFYLGQNYPNPFNPSTKIKYSVPVSSNVSINIFDVLGNQIESLVNEEKSVRHL